MTTRTPITLSPELQQIIDRLAEAEQRHPEEVLKSAVEEYAKGSRLERLARWGSEHARKKGFQESDVLPAIQQTRGR
jgi:predicted transcriptional regulator